MQNNNEHKGNPIGISNPNLSVVQVSIMLSTLTLTFMNNCLT